MHIADKRYSVEIKIWHDFSNLFTQNRLSNTLFSSPQNQHTPSLINVQAAPLVLIAMIYALSSSLTSPKIAVFWCGLFVQNKVRKNKKSKAEPEKSSNTGALKSIRLRSGVWEQRRHQRSVLIWEYSPGPVSQQKAQRYSRKYSLSPLDIPLPIGSALTLWKLLALIFKYQLHSWRWYPSC